MSPARTRILAMLNSSFRLVGVSTFKGLSNQNKSAAPVQVIRATVDNSKSVTERCWIPRAMTCATSQAAWKRATVFANMSASLLSQISSLVIFGTDR